MKKHKIVGIGELLWDVLPGGKRMGGAPVNFAFYTHVLGAEASVVSAIGNDASGDELLAQLATLGLDLSALQRNDHPTSRVEVVLDATGVPTYNICENVAWDYISCTQQALETLSNADAVCWGSLAQRAATSKASILQLVDAAPDTCLKVFDINLRLNYYDRTGVLGSIERADILKLNEDELPIVARFCGIEGDVEQQLARIIERYALRYIVFTEGAKQSRVMDASGHLSTLATPHVTVADTVGAGDSFTATFTTLLLQGLPMEECHRCAVEVSAYVCTQQGAIAPLPEKLRIL